MQQYFTLKHPEEDAQAVTALCERFAFQGAEVFMDDVCNRDEMLFSCEQEKQQLAQRLQARCVKRLHCSYWAYPTSFLTNHHFGELVERFGGEDKVAGYYGDLTGEHMFARWMQEYELASALGAQSYTFHLIDYAPIDGMWGFTISRADICQAMIYMIQRFLNCLLQHKLLSADTPQIEVENAGWGLEYGLQTADDFALMFSQLYDPFDKVRIGWDINHLLHALGGDAGTDTARFFLPACEVTESMRALEKQYGASPSKLAVQWLESNLLDARIAAKAGAVQLSDCALKRTEYFTNGILNGAYHQEIAALSTWEEREDYGVKIVLSEYDSHEVLGTGALCGSDMQQLLSALAAKSKNVVLLHELKNSTDVACALDAQVRALLGKDAAL
ncbi:MAG: hypothetical protein RSC00_05790 [Ruthenibacterium sp.]